MRDRKTIVRRSISNTGASLFYFGSPFNDYWTCEDTTVHELTISSTRRARRNKIRHISDQASVERRNAQGSVDGVWWIWSVRRMITDNIHNSTKGNGWSHIPVPWSVLWCSVISSIAEQKAPRRRILRENWISDLLCDNCFNHCSWHSHELHIINT